MLSFIRLAFVMVSLQSNRTLIKAMRDPVSGKNKTPKLTLASITYKHLLIPVHTHVRFIKAKDKTVPLRDKDAGELDADKSFKSPVILGK